MKALFTQSFLDTLDEFMSCYYDQYTTRTDYLSFLYYIERSMSANWQEEPGFAYFEHNKLRNVFGKKQVKKVRKWKLDLIISRLMDQNVIIRTSFDPKRGKTRRYGYHIWFNFEQKVTVFGLKSEEIDQKLLNSILPQVDLTDKDVRVQYQMLTSNRFQIDMNSALDWVETEFYENRKIDFNQKKAYDRMIFDLNAKRVFVTKGVKSSRIFSSYNTMKKELRSFCSIDGEALENIDLKSSQPLLLAWLFKKRFPGKESDALFRLVTEGDIYDWFLSKANESGIYSYKVYDCDLHALIEYSLLNREDSKLAFMRFIFSKSNRGQRPVYEKIFKQEFPYLWTKFKLFENLASDLQLIESNIFIPVASEYALRGCLSIHDSLSFKSDLKSEIINSLELKFSEFSISGYTLT